MNQLEALQKLQVKTKEFDIPRVPREGEQQTKIKFTALALDDMKLLNISENVAPDEAMDSMFLALAKSLSTKEETVTAEIVGTISAAHMVDLMDILMEVNNFDEDGKKDVSRVKEMLAKRKDANSNSKPEE
jgi:hypothetical protein